MDHNKTYLLFHNFGITPNSPWLLWWGLPEECTDYADVTTGLLSKPGESSWLHSPFDKGEWVLSLGNDATFHERFYDDSWTIIPNYSVLPSGICGECEGPIVFYEGSHYLCGECRGT